MSKVAIKGNASGTGTFTIAAPNSNTDRTLVLPDEAGTVVTNAGASFTGDVSVDTDTLFVDVSEDRVGINTSTPKSVLDLGTGSGGVTATPSGSYSDYAISLYGSTASTQIRNFIGAGEGSAVAAGIGFVDTGGGGSQGITFSSGNLSSISEVMRTDGNGYVLMGRTNIAHSSDKGFGHRVSDGYTFITRNTGSLCLDLAQQSTGAIIRFNNSSLVDVGSIDCTASSTSYTTSSDYRLKENVVDMTGAIDRVKALKPSQFNFLADPDTIVDGFIAHEAQAVVPEAVTGVKDGVEVWQDGEELPEGVSVGDNKLDENGNTIPVYQGIDQSKLVPLLTGALQEAIARIETLEAEVATLKGASA